jgi:hypothetical protein
VSPRREVEVEVEVRERRGGEEDVEMLLREAVRAIKVV